MTELKFSYTHGTVRVNMTQCFIGMPIGIKCVIPLSDYVVLGKTSYGDSFIFSIPDLYSKGEWDNYC